jgi:hypothetical protein
VRREPAHALLHEVEFEEIPPGLLRQRDARSERDASLRPEVEGKRRAQSVVHEDGLVESPHVVREIHDGSGGVPGRRGPDLVAPIRDGHLPLESFAGASGGRKPGQVDRRAKARLGQGPRDVKAHASREGRDGRDATRREGDREDENTRLAAHGPESTRGLAAGWKGWALLTLLVWGLFAFDRGLYQDDVSMLSIAQEARLSPGLPAALFTPMGTPTRRLLGLPFFLASATSQPVLFLQLFYGGVWLAIGWAAARLTKSLFPGASRTAWLAGALTVTATSDMLTNSLVATGYNVCVLLGLLALDSGVRFVRDDRPAWLVCAMACALGSVYTIDGAAVALALAPLLFLVAAGGFTARALALVTAWSAALVPYGLTTFAGLRDPSNYLAAAARPLAPIERLTHTFILAANNVLPWQWALDRPPFGEPPPHVLPAWLAVAAAAAGLATLRHGLRHAGEDEESAGAPRPGLVLAWLAAAVLLSNAAYAAVQFSEDFYRTHVLTRVLTSIVVAWAAGRLLARRDRGRLLGGALAGTFLAFGVAGGIERQDYYLSIWRRHRAELTSIVEQVPRARPDTELLLVLPYDPAFQAMEVTYLARRWTTLLYPDPAFRPVLFLWSPDAGTACEAEPGGFRCLETEERDCFAKGTCPGRKLAWAKTIVLTFDPAVSRFTLEDEIPGILLGGKAGPGDSYRPRALILPGGPDPRLGGILVPERGLARAFPSAP